MNNVCFCFPFPFFFPTVPAVTALSPAPSGCTPPSPPGVDEPLPPDPFLPLPPPGCHAGAAGALSPRMFRNDWFPPTAALGRRAELLVGSSGNADFESAAGPPFVRAPGPGMDVGARTTGGDGAAGAPEDAHGVTRWA